jgi:predicted dehydrogenase
MHLLLLGHSKLVKRRILPILAQLPQITQVSVAKFASSQWPEDERGLLHARYDSYEQAALQCEPDLVYVSTVNSAHHALAQTWLERSCHVLIDKPATLCLREARSLVELAQARKALVAEATVYTFHPQVALIRNLFVAEGCLPRYATAQFSFPPLEPSNFRYQAALGGGALFDTAAYAVSVGRFYFNKAPSTVMAVCNERAPDGLCLAYSLLLQYPGGQSLVGHFGFNTEYVNRLSLVGERLAIEVDRVFTPPDAVANPIAVRRRNVTTVETSAPANAFRCFFEHVFHAIETGQHSELAGALLYDAHVTERLRHQLQAATK